MRKLLKKWTAVMLSATMAFGTTINQPVRAEEHLDEVPEEGMYATGAYTEDMSKISDDMKIDTLEEYYDILEQEEREDILEIVEGEQQQEELPDSVDLSTSEYFPAIGNQKSLGACVSFAQTYYQFTYEMNRKMKRTTTKENTFSPIYPYNFIANKNGSGGTFANYIYSLLQYKGTIPWSNTDYSYDAKTWSPTKENWEEADNYRIANYYYISPNLGYGGYEISSPKDSDLDIIKSALSRGEMICTSTYAYSWQKARIGENSPYTGEIIVTDVVGFEGGHRVTIVGYDDNIWVDINGDGQVQEAEKGAFKVANSWGEGWGNSGFCWFSYDVINNKSQVAGEAQNEKNVRGLYNFARIAVDDYDSDSDIKLVYTLNTDSRKELNICVKATDIVTGNTFTKEATPYYISDGNSDSRNLSFDGTESRADGTMAMDLDTVVPGLTSESFYNYEWNVTFEERNNNTYRTVIKDVKVVDYNTQRVHTFDTTFPQTINGEEIELEYNPNAQGYDLQVTDISYINLETGEKNGRIEPGDRIQFESTIKNIGDMKVAKNQKLSVLFTTNQKTVWNGGTLLETGMKIDESLSISAVSGEEKGVITFSETGTYSVTAWANYNNALSEEYEGNGAENNKKTITIQVLPEEGGIKVTSFTASNLNPQVGEAVTFKLSLKYGNTVQTNLKISAKNGQFVFNSGYFNGAQKDVFFSTAATYDVVATVKDVDTGEEVTIEQCIHITVRDKEKGYDFEVSGLTYSMLDTGISKSKIYVGDSIRPRATVTNVGELDAPDNLTMSMSFQIGDNEENKVWDCTYTGKKGLATGERKTLYGQSGGQRGDGFYTFTEPGIYTITAWVNDTNEIPGELGGNIAANNKETITVEVLAKENMTKVEGFEADKTSVIQGDRVNFTVTPLVTLPTTLILNVYTEDGELYESEEFSYNTSNRSYCFEEVGTYYVQAMTLNLGNGEKGVTSKIPITVAPADGYDLSVGMIGYQNTETNEVNGEVVVGGSLKFNAIIKNIGNEMVNEVGYLTVKYHIQGEGKDETIRYDNNTLVTYLHAGYLGFFQSNKGGANDDGIYTFDKAGTYTLTVSVNDDHRFPNELTARNNQRSITIKVVEPSSITFYDFTADQTEIKRGETVNFTIDCYLTHMSWSKYEIYKEDGTLYEERGYNYPLYRNIMFEDTGTYDVRAVMEDLITGEIKATKKIRITVSESDGYDLSVVGISFVNVDTRMNGTKVKPGDRVRLQAIIQNIGNTKAPDNTMMKVTYQVTNGNKTILYNDQFKNRSGLLAGGRTRLNSNKGGISDDGIYTFTESGTYTITVSVNDDNAFPDEICGNKAKNNKMTITVTVVEPEKRIHMSCFEASAEEVIEGDTVMFWAGVLNVNSAMIKLHIYGMNGVTYHGSYIMGTDAEYQFQQAGTYYIQATIIDPSTSEEVDTEFITVVVRHRQD